MFPKTNGIISSSKAKALDKKAQEKFGVSSLILMENAGRAVAEEVMKVLKNYKSKRVAVFCGKGNNGSDGLVTARHLLALGIKPDIFLASKSKEVSNEAKVNLKILQRLKQKIIEVDEKNLSIIKNKIHRYQLIVDALLGIGLKGKVKGIYGSLIDMINRSKAYVLSVDVPSGLDANTGKVLGVCVKADRTVTFVAKKKGMILGKGQRLCGKVTVKDLGIPLY
ncbi:MAG: NAD(P)H-hydrate epimerase [Candidatus Omnitrophica bacterium]|nr:NAD(P)H-hydrate epimerase [Candidatus Omnitrophota bacterium]